MTRETVAWETPAARATSLLVARAGAACVPRTVGQRPPPRTPSDLCSPSVTTGDAPLRRLAHGWTRELPTWYV
ncbi:hypothetical protein H340_12927 [Streptomyces mobaraensis NBRC 13819 = DSM 40847]|uniref:Uncharacterized protein n=1 Tax=Streptomyces mobaraensis (strain ATCC 29032 / DSM 40847 / JCM 4168 / NBRC 13819 / NCIMB 11159 / IPCR 16-22) TaxID=1223523 RepID=M3B2A8_STRM1|nr:hypothetical protein H340_12927 [Streptomyces mobaraensis NBRC 13819 = DSM 40847]